VNNRSQGEPTPTLAPNEVYLIEYELRDFDLMLG
jgi:hypothetical protein